MPISVIKTRLNPRRGKTGTRHTIVTTSKEVEKLVRASHAHGRHCTGGIQINSRSFCSVGVCGKCIVSCRLGLKCAMNNGNAKSSSGWRTNGKLVWGSSSKMPLVSGQERYIYAKWQVCICSCHDSSPEKRGRKLCTGDGHVCTNVVKHNVVSVKSSTTYLYIHVYF